MSPSVVFSTEALIFFTTDLFASAAAFLLGLLGSYSATLRIFERTAVRQRDALGWPSRIREHLEGTFSPTLAVVPSSLDECFIGQKPSDRIGQRNDRAPCRPVRCGFPRGSNRSRTSLELVPRILLELLLTQRQATVLLVDFEYYDLKVGADLGELARMLTFLVHHWVGDMHQTVPSSISTKTCRS